MAFKNTPLQTYQQYRQAASSASKQTTDFINNPSKKQHPYGYEEDDRSVSTTSTASLSDTDSICSDFGNRRVSFSDTIVTDVRTRPFTPTEEVSNLFYSPEETDTFRQAYELERRQSDLSFNRDDHLDDDRDLSDLNPEAKEWTIQPAPCRRISYVVVTHNEKHETFLNLDDSKFQKDASADDNFFDSDSFWRGDIVWH